MGYTQLTEKTVIDYLRRVPEMKSVFSDMSDLNVREIGDGNLNYVYIITSDKNADETVVLKQAVPFLRIVGEGWPLPKERMTFEIMALETEERYCSGLVPKVYHASHEMSLVIMQNLKDHAVLRGEMNEGKYFPRLSEDISTFMARMLFYTSDWYLDHRTKKGNVQKFINIDLCKITEDFVFSHPFYKSDTNIYNEELSRSDIDLVQQDHELKIRQAEMKYIFMTRAEALVHGDLHTGSIMVNENETYIIDPEFAFFGPVGYDTGLYIGNSFLAYLAHAHRQVLLGNDPTQYRNWIADMIREMWNKFYEKFDRLWAEHQNASQDPFWDHPGAAADHAEYRKRSLARIFEDTLGVAGSAMIRRTLGLAKVSDIADIKNLKARAKIDRMALEMGKELIIKRDKFAGIESVVDLAQSISPADQAIQ